MSQTLYAILARALLIYAGVCAAMYVFQRSLIYYPTSRAVTAPESTWRLPVDGAEVLVTVRPHEGSKAIVYFGGNGEDVSLNLETYARAP